MKAHVSLHMITGLDVRAVIDIRDSKDFKTFFENNQDKIIPDCNAEDEGVMADHIVGYKVKVYERDRN